MIHNLPVKVIDTPDSFEDVFKTSVYTITVTIHQNRDKAMSDKVMLNGVTQWIQKELEKTDKLLKERHGLESGYSFVISYSETNRIDLTGVKE